MISFVPPPGLSSLHLLGQFGTLYTGAEREILDMQRLLSGRRSVHIWSDTAPHRGYAEHGVAAIQPFAHRFPRDGVLLVAGVHVGLGPWLKYARFERIIVLYNLANHLQLFAMIERVREATGVEPELIFVSHMLQLSVSLPGAVVRSVMNIDPFVALVHSRLAQVNAGANEMAPKQFVVGRASRDALDKHHPDDPALYRMLASRGIQVRVMGGTCLAPALEGVERIELLPAGAQSVPEFYASLDVCFYRTGVSTEAYGRVVVEAMASGLPVVAHRRGGYTEIIEDGKTGFLIDTQEEAYDAVLSLHAATNMRAVIGLAASQKAEELHGPVATERELAFLLR
ncbi:MAG: glycosyltransferase family 4 protein [Polaromonas sp.]|uniref:glycosyltransferase n=1 Tax=Polaromonas sp. TaxID=1869339 RepID=UPI001790EDFB|nr:glycosyltransferase [Polaromonas sp.]MBA3595447.1 glycosyltransferase family 4 protein [Polaromonas sp.]